MQKHCLIVPVVLAAIAAVVTGLAAPPGTAQAAQPQNLRTATQSHEAMERLGWMIGKWEGSGWVESAEPGPREFSYSVNVRPAFDGLLLVVDGVGYEKSNDWIPYAEQLLISDPPNVALPGPPGTYSWRELSFSMFRANEAQGTERSLQVGYPISQRECDRVVADAARRANCRAGELKWSRVTISLNDDGEWVQTREWQEVQGDDRSWHTYFKVVLQRAK